MEQKLLTIGIVIFLVMLGAITTIIILVKKKKGNENSNIPNGNNPVNNDWVCENIGCSNKPCEKSNNLITLQSETCYKDLSTCQQNCILTRCSNTYPKGYCDNGYTCDNGRCPMLLPEGIYTISTTINNYNNITEDTCLSLTTMTNSQPYTPFVIGRKQQGKGSYVYNMTTQIASDVFYRYTGKILQVSSNSAKINTNINFNNNDIILGNNNQTFDIVVFNNNNGTYTGTIKNSNNFICFDGEQSPGYDSMYGYNGIPILSNLYSPIQFTFTKKI